jgi:hypothetical protein
MISIMQNIMNYFSGHGTAAAKERQDVAPDAIIVAETMLASGTLT